MGWNTGNGIFDPVCKKLQTSHLWDGTRKEILVTLIRALQEGDWDTEDESLEKFEDDPIVVAAFRETCPEMFVEEGYDEFRGRW